MSATNIADSRWRTVVLLSGFAIVVALFASVLIRWPDNFFADDSYFYFQVAWNLARGLGSTFNNIIPTNGYHPLWMLVCTAIFKVFPSKIAAIHGIGAVISLFDVGALLFIFLILRRTAPGFWWAAFFLYIPFSFLSQLGTEGALSGFFLAALTFAAYEFCTTPSGIRGALFALCGSLAVLSRLDNIFIVSLIYLAAFFVSPSSVRSQVRRFLLIFIPVYLLFWGAYVESNLHWFGTVQPISGLLKAHSHGEVRHIHMPPHIAIAGLLIIIPSILILARYCLDTFFRVVELPFAVGVLFHAAYISFVMSSETRWSWYYTSWMLLSSILLSRVLSLLLAKRGQVLRDGLAALSLVLLLLVWYRLDDRVFGHLDNSGVAYQKIMNDQLGLHTVLAFDKPGRLAYYTDARIIALDGLMGDLQFQHDLATKGIAAFDAAHQVDRFMGPPQPLDDGGRQAFCERIYLSSVKFHCVASGSGKWIIDGVEVFARLSGESAGSLQLSPHDLLLNVPGEVAVWRLTDRSAISALPQQ